jgi:hypothetical protein
VSNVEAKHKPKQQHHKTIILSGKILPKQIGGRLAGLRFEVLMTVNIKTTFFSDFCTV